jgi:hypothetical protein
VHRSVVVFSLVYLHTKEKTEDHGEKKTVYSDLFLMSSFSLIPFAMLMHYHLLLFCLVIKSNRKKSSITNGL